MATTTTTTAHQLTPATLGEDLYSSLLEVRAAHLSDGNGAVMVRAALLVLFWAARSRRPASPAAAPALEPAPRDRVAEGNAALIALQLEEQARERRAYRARVQVEAERDAVAAALAELATARPTDRRYQRAADALALGGVAWSDEPGGGLWVSRGGSDHRVTAAGACSCLGAGRDGRRCWASGFAEALGVARAGMEYRAVA